MIGRRYQFLLSGTFDNAYFGVYQRIGGLGEVLRRWAGILGNLGRDVADRRPWGPAAPCAVTAGVGCGVKVTQAGLN